MALTDLWLSSQEQLQDKHVQQIIAFAGEGKLSDGGIASSERVQTLMEIGVGGVMMGRPALGYAGVFDLFKNELGFNDPAKPLPSVSSLKQRYDEIYNRIGGDEKYRDRFHRVVDRKKPSY